jgi:hypothetical protein
MPLVNCPECGATVSSDAAVCPQCGYPRPGAPGAKPSRGLSPGWVILGIMVVGLLAVGMLGLGMYRLIQRASPRSERHPEELVDFVDSVETKPGSQTSAVDSDGSPALPRIDRRLADWAGWDDVGRYDWIIGSDVLYGETMHPHLRRIFGQSLAPGGRVLLADTFRAVSLRLLEALEVDGWKVALTKWSVGEEADRRPIGLFELEPSR